MKTFICASAPSNIALIKYMGKNFLGENLPTNASLSYTLEHLQTRIVIRDLESVDERNHAGVITDHWRPLEDPEFSYPVHLSEKGRKRFLEHFSFLKKYWQIPGSYLIESANNFPADCGLASSASSFAALTLATSLLAQEFNICDSQEISLNQLSQLSQRGSGSSCRSFFSPWSIWRKEGAESAHLPLHSLIHQVVLVETEKKSVSSSEAHQRVVTSALFLGRKERAEKRLDDLVDAIEKLDWKRGFELCWAEFWDMHALFVTSVPNFLYMKPKSLAVLEEVKNIWETEKDGPWVTMDAGANVHLLYRSDQRNLTVQMKSLLQKFGQVMES